MRKAPLVQGVEPDPVFQSYIASPYVSWISLCGELAQIEIAQATKIYMHRPFGRKDPQPIGRFLRQLVYRRGSPAHQPRLVPFLCYRPCNLRLGGYQDPAEHAFDPEHAAGERAPDPRSVRTRQCHHDTLARRLADHPHQLRHATPFTPTKPVNPATLAPHDELSSDISGGELLLQDILDAALAQACSAILRFSETAIRTSSCVNLSRFLSASSRSFLPANHFRNFSSTRSSMQIRNLPNGNSLVDPHLSSFVATTKIIRTSANITMIISVIAAAGVSSV